MSFNHESFIYMEMYSGLHEACDFWEASYTKMSMALYTDTMMLKYHWNGIFGRPYQVPCGPNTISKYHSILII